MYNPLDNYMVPDPWLAHNLVGSNARFGMIPNHALYRPTASEQNVNLQECVNNNQPSITSHLADLKNSNVTPASRQSNSNVWVSQEGSATPNGLRHFSPMIEESVPSTRLHQNSEWVGSQRNDDSIEDTGVSFVTKPNNHMKSAQVIPAPQQLHHNIHHRCFHHHHHRTHCPHKHESFSDDETNADIQPSRPDINTFQSLSQYQSDSIDELLNSVAQEVGLSTTEHAALKMDLFRNYIRSYDALKNSIEDNQLPSIIHPILAEIVSKNVIDMDQYILAEDAPSSIPNVPSFRHGAIFVHRIILVGTDKAKIAATYALDVAKKLKIDALLKRLSALLDVSANLIRLIFKNDLISSHLYMSLESLGITDGSAIEAYVLSDTFERLNAPLSSLISVEPHPSIKEAIALLRPNINPDIFKLFSPGLRRGQHKRQYGIEAPDGSMSWDELKNSAVPTMAAMEKLAKTFDNTIRSGKSIRQHPCTCNCGVCGPGGLRGDQFNVPKISIE